MARVIRVFGLVATKNRLMGQGGQVRLLPLQDSCSSDCGARQPQRRWGEKCNNGNNSLVFQIAERMQICAHSGLCTRRDTRRQPGVILEFQHLIIGPEGSNICPIACWKRTSTSLKFQKSVYLIKFWVQDTWMPHCFKILPNQTMLQLLKHRRLLSSKLFSIHRDKRVMHTNGDKHATPKNTYVNTGPRLVQGRG